MNHLNAAPDRRLLRFFLILGAGALMTIGGCGGARSQIVGEFVNDSDDNVTLFITEDDLGIRAGPLTLASPYTVESVSGNTVSVRLVNRELADYARATITVVAGDVDVRAEWEAISGRWTRIR